MTNATATRNDPPERLNASLRTENTKRLRYPHPHMVPFVLETYGRMGQDALQLLRTNAPTDKADRTEALTTIYYQLSTILQHCNAESTIAAYPPAHHYKQPPTIIPHLHQRPFPTPPPIPPDPPPDTPPLHMDTDHDNMDTTPAAAHSMSHDIRPQTIPDTATQPPTPAYTPDPMTQTPSHGSNYDLPQYDNNQTYQPIRNTTTPTNNLHAPF